MEDLQHIATSIALAYGAQYHNISEDILHNFMTDWYKNNKDIPLEVRPQIWVLCWGILKNKSKINQK